MKRTKKFGYMVIGIMLTLLVSNFVVPAAAALVQKTISVSTGVSIYMDDNKLNPTDANGKAVEVFVYNGTTYLPVRAVSEALGKPVQWDGKSQSVYIGKHSSTTPAVMLNKLDCFTGENLLYEASGKDNLGITRSNVIYPRGVYNTTCSNVYKINGQYSKIAGTLFQKYDFRTAESQRTFTSEIQIYGDGKLLWSAKMGPGIEPIDFSVDLTGVLELQVDYFAGGNSGAYSCLSNCGLYA